MPYNGFFHCFSKSIAEEGDNGPMALDLLDDISSSCHYYALAGRLLISEVQQALIARSVAEPRH
jgi:hypothetical protein